MQQKIVQSTVWRGCLAGLVLLAGSLTGCQKGMFHGDVIVHMDSRMKTEGGIYPSLELDIVAVTPQEFQRWNAFPVDQYFQAGCSFRQDAARYTMEFSDGHRGPVTLKKNDALWKKWKKRGAIQLILVANLPGVWQAKPGSMDGRRLILPLSAKSWPSSWGSSKINVNILPSGLVCQTPIKQDSKKPAAK